MKLMVRVELPLPMAGAVTSTSCSPHIAGDVRNKTVWQVRSGAREGHRIGRSLFLTLRERAAWPASSNSKAD